MLTTHVRNAEGQRPATMKTSSSSPEVAANIIQRNVHLFAGAFLTAPCPQVQDDCNDEARSQKR